MIGKVDLGHSGNLRMRNYANELCGKLGDDGVR
jgi:hypothetical protein